MLSKKTCQRLLARLSLTNQAKTLTAMPKRFYEKMTTEQYLINARQAFMNTQMQRAKLRPLLEANHTVDTVTVLHGMPVMPYDHGQMNYFLDAVGQFMPDLIFLQLDPMPYITRQRYMAHKCALNEVEDYDVKGVVDLQDPVLGTWEEAVVNLVTLDMLRANNTHMKIDYTKGLATYAYPDLQEPRTKDNLHPKFIEAITNHIICDNWSPYYEVNQILFKALMGKHKVLLGDMPELLLRQILGNSLSLDDMKDIFKFVLEQISKSRVPITMSTATLQYFSHIFLLPKDLYMTALLRNVMAASNACCVYVGTPHYAPIQNYWQPPPYGVNFSQATKIPKRIQNETNEMLIEKQAIMDVLLDTRIWGEKYVTNPFPYIEKDITKIPADDLKNFKKHFYVNMRKYQAFRDRVCHEEAYIQVTELNKKYAQISNISQIPEV